MKDLSYIALMDIYGKALTEKQRTMLADYYERDFSLSEIADNYSVSRQAVHFAVKQGEESLRDLESKFGIYAFVSRLSMRVRDIKRSAPPDTANELTDLEEFIRSYYGTVWQP